MQPVFRNLYFFLLSTGFSLFVLLAQCASVVADESPKVAVVIGKAAPELDRYAATELCGYIEKLYGIHTMPSDSITAAADTVIFVGNPETNPAVAKVIGAEAWPKLTDQGLTLKRATSEGKPALVVGQRIADSNRSSK